MNILSLIQHNQLSKFMKIAEKKNTVGVYFPLLVHTVQPIKMNQNPKYHQYDVYDHIVAVVRRTERFHPQNVVMQLAGLTHDNRKGFEGIRNINKYGQPSDLNHESAGVEPAREFLQSLGIEEEVIRKVLFLVEYHGIHFTQDTEDDAQTEVSRVRDAVIMKVLKKIKNVSKNKTDFDELLWLLFEFKKMDALGFNKEFGKKQYRICEWMYPRYVNLAKTLED